MISGTRCSKLSGSLSRRSKAVAYFKQHTRPIGNAASCEWNVTGTVGMQLVARINPAARQATQATRLSDRSPPCWCRSVLTGQGG